MTYHTSHATRHANSVRAAASIGNATAGILNTDCHLQTFTRAHSAVRHEAKSKCQQMSANVQGAMFVCHGLMPVALQDPSAPFVSTRRVCVLLDVF